jgi:hypothetical protein
VYETLRAFGPVSSGEGWFLAATLAVAVLGFAFVRRVYRRGPLAAYVVALLISWIPVQVIAYVTEGRQTWLPSQHSAIFFWGDSVLLPMVAAAFAGMRRLWLSQQPAGSAARPVADRWWWLVPVVVVALVVGYLFHAGQIGVWSTARLHEPAKVWHDYLVYPLFVYYLGSQVPFLWQVSWRRYARPQAVLAALALAGFLGWFWLGHVYDPAHRHDKRPLLGFASAPVTPGADAAGPTGT